MTALTIVLAPDSFKGSASALEVAEALAAGISQSLPRGRLVRAPMADGGEGTLDCVAAARGGRWQNADLEAIHGERITARWYWCDDGLAVIESASVLGLPLIESVTDAPSLGARGSFALGTLLRAVLDAGARRIAIGLGGSACNDAGLGLLLALGCVGYDGAGTRVPPTMNGLLALTHLDFDGLDPRLAQAELDVLCDVDNPLLGEAGASRVYGPQKGLDTDEIEAVEAAFTRLSHCAGTRTSARDAGSGAAGGLGFALAAIGGALGSGAERLMAMTGLPATLAGADLVVTGEGRSDRQTLSGKLPLAVARTAAPVPTVLVAGAIAEDARSALARQFAACHTLADIAGSVDAARAEPLRWLRAAGERVGEQARQWLGG